jgi:hypothetical protein
MYLMLAVCTIGFTLLELLVRELKNMKAREIRLRIVSATTYINM